MTHEVEAYVPKSKVRMVTAASLFDGHDAAINVMRRVMQASGAEIIHLGHNRSAAEVVESAIQEDVHSVALTSYQGGHMEYFKYIRDLLDQRGGKHIKLFGGGGGVILPEEVAQLGETKVARIFTPDDGRALGLQGMINEVLRESDYSLFDFPKDAWKSLQQGNWTTLARLLSFAEAPENAPDSKWIAEVAAKAASSKIPVLGVTGTGGAGKSSLVDELVRRFLRDFPKIRIGILSVDPSKRKTGGALLGDRIRMNAIYHPGIYMRSMATRQANLALAKNVQSALQLMKLAPFDLVILETSGIGQSDTEVVDHSDLSLYVMTPEYGAATQLEKIDMIDYADLIAINKFDRRGAHDALRDVKKQYQRARKLFDAKDEDLLVYGTIASQFSDPGTERLYQKMTERLAQSHGSQFRIASPLKVTEESKKVSIIPPQRTRYLSEIAETIRAYNESLEVQAIQARKLQSVTETAAYLAKDAEPTLQKKLQSEQQKLEKELGAPALEKLKGFEDKRKRYEADEYRFKVRDREMVVRTHTESLSHTRIPKVLVPKLESWGEVLRWEGQENVPGLFPFTAGVFPFKREFEDPTRMFAGEGAPERTNRRFHYVSQGMPALRLSTAFDSVTLYGEDPDLRPDIYGKIGNSGVSVCCLDDAKKLYSGFDLCDPKTSVSMTINGPAPLVLAFFLNAAIDQQCEKEIIRRGEAEVVAKRIEEYYRKLGMPRPCYLGPLPEGNDGLGLLLLGSSGKDHLPHDVYEKIRAQALASVRGTVQADILKEDQAQNTCIFSTEFALKLMGDVQASFIKHHVRNFYSVSISGYHIAEAGANPISQLAFTLANGFTFVEYYLSRGMVADDFAPNLSFFFSNGVDPEYAVIGRVARRIWSKAMKLKYGASERSQKLKYHIQTSGRSLHAQEIAFNDIRTTLQALYAIADSCNSLHTNAYDEAITTPTEESVRRAIAIQMVINYEFGMTKNQNPFQGSYLLEYLTDQVEAAVLAEFDRITERGGVLGAMETMYQRGKIQEESLYYETLKHSGEYPIVGVNTFLSKEGSPTVLPREVIRSTEEEKAAQIRTVAEMKKRFAKEGAIALRGLQEAAVTHQNLFDQMMETSRVCTLGQMTHALYEVGGKYRRNM